MKLEQFRQIIELVNTGSFSQAARNLYISQPNLSNSVKQLEKELGFPLFVRTSDGVIPTRQGRDVIEHFKIIQGQYDMLEHYCQNSDKPSRLSLRVATLNFNRTNSAFAAIARRYMGAPIDFSFLHYTSIAPVIDMVVSCQVDLALIGILSPYNKNMMAKLQNSRIEYNKLSSSPLSVVVGPQNPLYNEAAVSLEHLYPFAMIYYGSSEDDPSYSLHYATGLSTRVSGLVRVNTSQLFYLTLQTSSAVGLVASSVDSFNQYNTWEGIRALQLTDCDIESEYGWIKLRRLPLPDIAAELLETVRHLF